MNWPKFWAFWYFLIKGLNKRVKKRRIVIFEQAFKIITSFGNKSSIVYWVNYYFEVSMVNVVNIIIWVFIYACIMAS